ncbi:trafficking protein particle complex subunit 6b-like isoform X1 [Narcine bancroftii]|uniref:trafficking protein particle complex subunit 6b-like isoform X1 n=1 Tax=Narcine bancroftii TaxID=1343680 RepID=UPI0038319400
MGFRAGQGLIERFTKETPSFKDELDIMKFICKEFWTNLFHKQIDNLRTNHQGTYVLQDNRFRLLTSVSSGKQYLEEAPKLQGLTMDSGFGAWPVSGEAKAASQRPEPEASGLTSPGPLPTPPPCRRPTHDSR